MQNEITHIVDLLETLNGTFKNKIYSTKEILELKEVPLDLKHKTEEINIILKKIANVDTNDIALLNEYFHYLRLHIMSCINAMDELEEFLRRIIVFTYEQSIKN